MVAGSAHSSGVDNHRSILAGATNTRASAGVPLRWAQIWVLVVEENLGWANPQRCKPAVKERSELIRFKLLLASSHRSLAIADA